MGDKIDGFIIKLDFDFDSGTPVLKGGSAEPVFTPSAASVEEDTLQDGTIAVIGFGTGVLGSIAVNGIAGLKDPSSGSAVTFEDFVWGGGAGVGLATCAMSTPEAAVFCGGMLSALVPQIIERVKHPDWDFRVGLLSGGLWSLARYAWGGNPVPFQGYRIADGKVDLREDELLANAMVDIHMDGAFWALSNLTAAVAQGYEPNTWVGFMADGLAWGVALSVFTNMTMGAPVEIPDDMKKAAEENNAENGAPMNPDVWGYIQARAGGLWEVVAGEGSSITIGPHISFAKKHLASPGAIGHELGGHGGQILREGLFSMYSQYVVWSMYKPYGQVPHEVEAFEAGEGLYLGGVHDKSYGDAIGGPLLGALYLLLSMAMEPESE